MQPETSTLSARTTDAEKNKFIISAVNGTGLYVLAYYLVWGVYNAVKVQASHFFHLRGLWTPSRVVYTLGDNEWWRTAVVTVYSMGPLVCLLVGLIAFRWYWRSERARRGQRKLLLLWVAFQACNAVFGALLADTFTQSGSWYVFDWLFRLGNVVNVVLALLAGLVQLGLGYFGAIAFLQAHDSRTVMRYTNRQKMVVSTLVVPWVVGSLFIMLLKQPYLTIQEILHLAMMGLLITPMALGCLNEVFSDTVKRPQATRIAWGLLALAVAIAVAWRLALSPPVVFG
ncbi:hypothetical protein MON38_09540 [Hymenobacter sp. DH14]|uniref:Uncharacterized protein n=1 Tax=Hymenobacter cyanobacteriorum TaxID=2926463 RepID=A0A9X1VFJ2_9BACT|nr:hypothetical protein [Hymenobacter cyanobacteriorum]MCI1187663.1 hypothetical protein [Hymenobacter cyanobacteriorum]